MADGMATMVGVVATRIFVVEWPHGRGCSQPLVVIVVIMSSGW